MAEILRGQVYFADLEPTKGREQAGFRPVLIISHEFFNTPSETVIAMALTSKEPKAGYPLTCEIKSIKLPKRSWVKISQVRILDSRRLSKCLGRLEQAEVNKIVLGLSKIIA